MMCQSCGQRPASIKINHKQGNKTYTYNICHACYQQRVAFGGGSLFDQFFGAMQNNLGTDPFMNQRFGGTYHPRHEINLADHFSARAKKVVAESANSAKEAGHKSVDTEHLLVGLTHEEEMGTKLLELLGINPEDLRNYLEENMDTRELSEEEEEYAMVDFSPRAKRVFELAFEQSRALGNSYIGSEHIFLGLLLEGEGTAAQALMKYKVTLQKAQKVIRDLIHEKGTGKNPRDEKSNTPTLDKFSTDLTVAAKDGKLDPVIGRHDEVARVVQILSRRTKNNPVLIGEPGVGKTAIAEGLAQKITSGNVSENLKGRRVVALNISAMVAGTKYRGEFEKRLNKVIDEVKAAKDQVIVFIDELHTIVGAGGSEGAIDASNTMKPALARGELQMIGATTLNEYRKHIEKDAALERRFQPVLVDEPSVETTISILRGLRDKYEAHHKVRITDEAIVAAASLSDRYLTDRFMPDKAIDLIDEAAAKIKLEWQNAPEEMKTIEKELKSLRGEQEAATKAKKKAETDKLRTAIERLERKHGKLESAWKKSKGKGEAMVVAADIEELISKWTGIPVQELAEEEVEKLLKLEERLHERVIGQNEAVEAVSQAIRRGRAGLKNPKRPIGSFIFLGPTGVGKTELTKALAQLMFGDEEAMIRLDMSEYMERHAVSRLVGSPPGYIGHDEGGQLTEKVRRKPYSVILLDEIEKAHPDVFNILLQILEDGRLTDAKGRVVDFKNTLVIATSNIGSDMIQEAGEKGLGFEAGNKQDKPRDMDGLKGDLMNELKKTFRPEFINRIDEIIVFHALTKQHMGQVADLLFKEVAQLLRSQNIAFEVSKAAKDELINRGYEPQFGARPLRRVIQKDIETPLASRLLQGTFQSGDTVMTDFKDGAFIFKKNHIRTRAKRKTATA